MENKIPTTEYSTIGQLIDKGEMIPKRWYWVDDSRIEITSNTLNPHKPLHEGKKALAVDIPYYLEEERNLWTGYLFEEIPTPSGKRPVLYRKIELLHLCDETATPDKVTVENMHLDNRQQGFYFFKKMPDGKLLELKTNDIPFLKRYYRAQVRKDEQGILEKKICIITTKVASYVLYEYYPSGTMKRKVEVFLEDADSLYEKDSEKSPYTVLDSNFPEGQSKSFDITSGSRTILTNHADPLWVPNILHD